MDRLDKERISLRNFRRIEFWLAVFVDLAKMLSDTDFGRLAWRSERTVRAYCNSAREITLFYMAAHVPARPIPFSRCRDTEHGISELAMPDDNRGMAVHRTAVPDVEDDFH
ncbi:MAG: hypothetical protein IH602_10555 [Bryobacteraceae bacterium]|nr:hypothetical protein [Bryobacteraceae bacterium]